MDSICNYLATVQRECGRVKGGTVEVTVIVKLDPAHAIPRCMNLVKLCGTLRDNVPDPC